MKTRTCVHCGRKFKRSTKRKNTPPLPTPDCGRCLIVWQEREGWAKCLPVASIKIQ